MSERWIALLRGINVGGHNKLAMADLRALASDCGAADVSTYIQSGNLLFSLDRGDTSAFLETLRIRIQSNHGFTPLIMLMRAEALIEAIAANPFPEADDKQLHLGLLARMPESVDEEYLAQERADDEQWQLHGRFCYLHAPSGLARSRLAPAFEKGLGVEVTMRNWRTVTKLADMV